VTLAVAVLHRLGSKRNQRQGAGAMLEQRLANAILRNVQGTPRAELARREYGSLTKR
jgi:hypothetical protein